jgi:hypothetical protein
MAIIKTFMIGVTICSLASCTLNPNEIREHEWKYGEGSRPGHDFFAFGGGVFKLSNDTIFFIDTAIATVIESKKNYLFYDNELLLKNLKTGKTAIYHDLGKVNAEDTMVTIEITAPEQDLSPPPPPPLFPEKK